MGIRVRLVFPEQLVKEPVIAHLVREFDVDANIRRASISESSGYIVCELEGESDAIERAIESLRDRGVNVELLGDVVEG